MNEDLTFFIFLFGLNLIMMSAISFGLHYFIALKSKPAIRAGWTAGISLLIALSVMHFFGGLDGPLEEYWFQNDAAASLGSLLIFGYWHRQFRRLWVEDPDDLPDGVTLANDDWRAGLLLVLAFCLVILIRAVFRISMQ